MVFENCIAMEQSGYIIYIVSKKTVWEAKIMKKITSAYANKMLRSLEEDKAFWVNKEAKHPVPMWQRSMRSRSFRNTIT